jgi:hypothetical protein
MSPRVPFANFTMLLSTDPAQKWGLHGGSLGYLLSALCESRSRVAPAKDHSLEGQQMDLG